MPSSLTAFGLTIALTFGGVSFASPQPVGDANAPAAVEDPMSDGAYLVATVALFGLAGLAGITRRDYVRARRRARRRDTGRVSTSVHRGPDQPAPTDPER